MVKFISENWANILLIIVGSFALATYILQERKKKIDAASLIVLQIDEFQERLREISTFIVDGQLNETAFYESLPLMDMTCLVCQLRQNYFWRLSILFSAFPE